MITQDHARRLLQIVKLYANPITETRNGLTRACMTSLKADAVALVQEIESVKFTATDALKASRDQQRASAVRGKSFDVCK